MNLLRAITKHCDRNGVAVSRFGRDAVNDPRLVHDLRQGREPGPQMIARVRAYLAAARKA